MSNFKKSFNLKIITLIIAQVFLFTSLAYAEMPVNIAHLRPELKAGNQTFQEGFLRVTANVQRTPAGLNRHFKILANVDLEEIVIKDFDNDPNTWVMFGDMSAIRLLNTVYPPEVIDILIPKTVQLIEQEIEKYGGKAGRVGVKGDEIWVLLPSRYTKEQVSNIRKDIQEKVAESITAKYWGCEVYLKKGEEILDASLFGYDTNVLYRAVQDISYNVLGGEDLVPGFYRAKSGIHMVFKGPDRQLLENTEEFKTRLKGIMQANVARLNGVLASEGVTVEVNNAVTPDGLLSPMVFFGAAQKGFDVEQALDRAERILNVEKEYKEEGGVDGMIDSEHQAFVDLKNRTLEPLSSEEQQDAIRLMETEEVSGVHILPNMLDPVYSAIGEHHLRTIAEPWLEPLVAQAMVRQTQQATLVGLLDVRYKIKEGRFRRALDKMFPTDEDKTQKLRGQKDDNFGLTVAFKYFNDALTGKAVKELGLPKEGHAIGNDVLRKEAEAIIKDVIGKLERKNVLLFRGPPDNWWFLFLGPTAQDFEDSPELMKLFVDNIAVAINGALRELGLEVEVGLRMNVVSSATYGRGVISIIETAKDLVKCRSEDSCSVKSTDRGNIVKEYDPRRHSLFIKELVLINRKGREAGIRFLTEKRMDIIKRRGGKGPLSQNDIDTMRVIYISGWLKEENLETYNRLASNQGAKPIEILENGAAVYKVLLPGSSREIEICLDPDTVRLMEELPAGVTLNIFGNQAIQMILGREGVIAKTGKLDEGDLDVCTENPFSVSVYDALMPALRLFHKNREINDSNVMEFYYLTSGPYTLSRLVIKLTSLGNRHFRVGLGDNMDKQAYYDLIYKKVNMVKGALDYECPPATGLQGLIYHHRYGMHVTPEASKFISRGLLTLRMLDTANRSHAISRLEKLFRHAKNITTVLEYLHDSGFLREISWRSVIVDALDKTNTLETALTSTTLSQGARKLILKGVEEKKALKPYFDTLLQPNRQGL